MSKTMTFTDAPTVVDSATMSKTMTFTDAPTILDGVTIGEFITPPTLDSAAVISTSQIRVTFSESIDPTTVSASDFTITNPSRTVDSVSVPVNPGNIIILFISPRLGLGNTPTVELTNPVSNIAGNVVITPVSVVASAAPTGSLSIQITSTSSVSEVATYRVTPDPSTGTGSLSVTDNGIGDTNPSSGIITLTPIPFAQYDIEITTVPDTFTATITKSSATLSTLNQDPTVIFTLIETETISTSEPTTGTESPELSPGEIINLKKFNATIVDKDTKTDIEDPDDLPEILFSGKNNPSGIITATENQVSIQVTTKTILDIDGSTFIDLLNLKKFPMSKEIDFTAIIPTIVTKETTTHQVVSTPPLERIIPGQTIILPVEEELIPDFGGLLKLELPSKSTASSVGAPENDWIVIEIDDDPINTPTLLIGGINDEPLLFLDIKYQFEEKELGFNWGDEANFDAKPKVTVKIPKTTSSDVVILSNGCIDVTIRTFEDGQWITGIDTVLSNVPSNDDFCVVVFESDHFSNKSVSGKARASAGDSSGSRGNTGVGTGASGGFAGILGTSLTINEVSYDKCDENIARILISSDADTPPSVTVHTTKLGSVVAILSDEQPYEELNKITRVDKYLYEIPISSDETFLMIIVTEEKGTTQNTVNAAVNLDSCEGTITIADVPEDELDEFLFNVPRIFDTKFQIENDTVTRADSASKSLYVSEQDLTITAIIDSETPLKRVELRTITLGQPDDEYIAMKMNVEPMIFFNTSLVSATIPSFLMQDPAIAYWIYVIDEELNEVESIHYTMGVKPILEPDVSLELDVPSVKRSGSIVRPSLYINNDQSPAYGIVSLIVDGIVVSERAAFLETGQTKVSFDWDVPSSGELSSYELQGKVDLYGSSEITSSAVMYSHPRTLSISAYDMKTLEIIEKDGNVLSEPVLLYASNAQTGEFKFQVTAPNGQCIIGSSDECSVQDSTKSNRGGLSSVQYEGQTLRIKYSGSDSVLERFSITSIDPIVGDWIVTLEAEEGFIPLAQAAKDLTVKVKHKIHSETITVYSD
ncbi:MAG: Ig-like domain-containing protein [Thaumarchaeota archaeon]|nr:Ig-like domain-containing protein [Nitrososphaerota archaeon]